MLLELRRAAASSKSYREGALGGYMYMHTYVRTSDGQSAPLPEADKADIPIDRLDQLEHMLLRLSEREQQQQVVVVVAVVGIKHKMPIYGITNQLQLPCDSVNNIIQLKE